MKLISTAAADQHFAWICKPHQDFIGSVLIFRTKIIWSGPEFGLVRCVYLNAAVGNDADKLKFEQSLDRFETTSNDSTKVTNQSNVKVMAVKCNGL